MIVVMGDYRALYVCENCGGIGHLNDLQADCRPGWTHGRLIKVDMESPVLRNARGAVDLLREVRVAGALEGWPVGRRVRWMADVDRLLNEGR